MSEDNPFGDNPYKPTDVPEPANIPAGQQESVSPLDAIIPTNPLAAIGCYCGIFSMPCCGLGIVLGPLAIGLGILGLRVHVMQESSYGAVTSKIRAWIGIVTGILGLIISIVFICLMFANRF